MKKLLDGKSILITGGTGSFGQAFTRMLLETYDIKRLAIFSRDELKQFEMSQNVNGKPMRYFIGDVRDYNRLYQAFRGIDVVIHAAALKHVSAAEYNPMECIKTNIHGAENVIRAAIEAGVKQVVALSTDKATNPLNLYGATKLASDKLFIAANNIAGGHITRFSVVRYGNVAGSRGSVVPLFKSLISQNAAELPITHPEMTRFWITIEEGVGFVIQALSRMKGGELFVPKIPSIRIVDLAHAMAPNLPTKVIGIRPGEKLHELMISGDDSAHTLEYPNHYVITPNIIEVPITYEEDALGEAGVPVESGFEYYSLTNAHFLSVEQIRELHEQ